MITINENVVVEKETMHCVLFEETTLYNTLAWEAAWHFFIGGDDDFVELYKRKLVDTYKEENAVYVLCSEYLFENESYIAGLLAGKKVAELTADILIPLSHAIEKVLK